ncbi:MAG: efflux transporter outer membrane subunit [Pelovirga sp.]
MRLLPLLLLPLLAACTLGPDYHRPELEVPTTWRQAAATDSPFADRTWWQAFEDPVLDQLVETAVHNNLELQLAGARVDQLLGLLQTSRAQFFPQTGYGIGVSRQDNAINPLSSVDPPAFTSYQGSVNVSWELDFWGRIRRANEAARAQLLASEEARRAVLVSLVANLATGYIALRSYDEQLEIANATLQSYAETLRIFRLRHQHGTISRVELSQIESQYESAAQTIPRLQALITQQEHLLSLLLGAYPGPIPRGRPLAALTPPPLPEVLPLNLLERRPDLRQAEQDLIAVNAGIGAARALYFPRVSLSGLLGRQSDALAELFRSGGGFWSMGADLAGPLVTFGAVEGQVAQAESLALQGRLRYEQAVKNAFREVEDGLVATLRNREQLASQQRQTEALDQYARLARLTFDNGSSSYLQVLDAERTLFSVRLSRSQTAAAVLVAHIDVYKALAGGWVDQVDPQTLAREPAAAEE